ncbi:13541_t:CDS:2 [Acaulospora colombiana]|uniref:13541_t:CDS:1 n=1 Tax=Acaulospora colombiana TaxID=27376 RepID=A0ACA9N5I5_9GLOM|nr:13541_t:CDS:2 [Acaulospora colombiana]
MAKRVIVDDSHPSITYTGKWQSLQSVDSGTNEYNGTVHKTTTPGSSIQFHFHGLPGVTLSLDGDTPRTLNATGNLTPAANTTSWSHVPLWSVEDLTNGDHTATIAVDEVNKDRPFYVDFFTARTVESGGVVIVDDKDGNIAYEGDWTLAGSIEDYFQTIHKSTTPGAKAIFQFNGTAVQVYGTAARGNRDVFTFALDSSSISTYSVVANQTSQKHTLLYDIKDLTPTLHRLVITTLNPQSASLDYIVYDSSLGANGSGNSPINSTSKKSLTGAIVGGVVGGIVFVLLLGALIYYRRRKRPGRLDQPYSEQSVKNIPISPFDSEIPRGGGGPAPRNDKHESPYVNPAPNDRFMPSNGQNSDPDRSIVDSRDLSMLGGSSSASDQKNRPQLDALPSSIRLEEASPLLHDSRNPARGIGGLMGQHTSPIGDIAVDDSIPPPPAYYVT